MDEWEDMHSTCCREVEELLKKKSCNQTVLFHTFLFFYDIGYSLVFCLFVRGNIMGVALKVRITISTEKCFLC